MTNSQTVKQLHPTPHQAFLKLYVMLFRAFSSALLDSTALSTYHQSALTASGAVGIHTSHQCARKDSTGMAAPK
eukprot:m.62301 g.62301  ORF g.62301 m.62301 type:complete len:74 (+) comp13789_c0_seq4:340-561(+)